MVDDIKQFNDKLVVFILLTAMMIVFIPSTSSKYVKEYPVDFTLSTKLAQFQLIWTDQTGSNAPEAKTISKGDIGFSSEGYYLLVAKGGNGGTTTTGAGNVYHGGYGGIVSGVFYMNPGDNDILEVTLGTSANRTVAGENVEYGPDGGDCYVETYGGPSAGGAGTILRLKNSGYSGDAINQLILLASGGGGAAGYSAATSTEGFEGGAGGSNFISSTSSANITLSSTTFAEYLGNNGAGESGAGGSYNSQKYVSGSAYKGAILSVDLSGGYGFGTTTQFSGGAGGGGGFAGGCVAGAHYRGGAGGGSSAINTTSSITNVVYQSSYSAARILEIYKEKMAEMISLDTNTNSSGQRISDLCVLGSEGYLYNKSDTSIYSDISFVAIYYLGTTAP